MQQGTTSVDFFLMLGRKNFPRVEGGLKKAEPSKGLRIKASVLKGVGAAEEIGLGKKKIHLGVSARGLDGEAYFLIPLCG